MRPVLLLDCDGVLLDWSSRISDFLLEKGNSPAEIESAMEALNRADGISSHSEIFLVSCPKAANNLFLEYNESRFAGELDIHEEGADLVIKELAKQYDIEIVTCIGDSPINAKMRMESLDRFYPNCFQSVKCLPFIESKSDYISLIRKHRDVVAFVDDNPKNVIDGIHLGVRSLQYTHKSVFPHEQLNGILPCEIKSISDIFKII